MVRLWSSTIVGRRGHNCSARSCEHADPALHMAPRFACGFLALSFRSSGWKEPRPGWMESLCQSSNSLSGSSKSREFFLLPCRLIRESGFLAEARLQHRKTVNASFFRLSDPSLRPMSWMFGPANFLKDKHDGEFRVVLCQGVALPMLGSRKQDDCKDRSLNNCWHHSLPEAVSSPKPADLEPGNLEPHAQS